MLLKNKAIKAVFCFAQCPRCGYTSGQTNREHDQLKEIVMSYDAKAIANYFLKRGMEDGVTISPLKLQKLIYFAHGWHLGIFDKPLINEFVEAWPYGPVISHIYHTFKHYGNNPIVEFAKVTRWDRSGNIYDDAIESPNEHNASENTLDFLDAIWQNYKNATAIQLSNKTHEEGAPWFIARQRGINIIKDEIIRDYYREKHQRNQEKAQNE